MSYLVLARKWRPQTFADLVGQEHVRRTLENAIAQNRVAHAFLFTGVRGVGKTTSARILAKSLNCANGPTITPCLQCAACLEIAAGTDVDVQEIDAASYTGVDDVRRLQETLPYRPQRDRFKILIVDEVHMLSANAWNAFLKTLEEPPPHVKFIFATTEVHKVPITILSRCQRYDFRMISAQTIASRLRYVLGEEKIEADDAAISLVAREAAGSMRDAMSLLDQAIAWAGEKLVGDEVARVLGVASRSVLHDLAASVVEGRAEDALGIVAQLVENGYDLAHIARDLLAQLRDVVVARVCKDPARLLDVSDKELESTLNLASKASPEDLVRIHQAFSASYDEIVKAPSPRASLEMTLIRLASRPPLLPLDDLMDRLADLERRLSGSSPPPRGGPSGRTGGAPGPKSGGGGGSPPPRGPARPPTSPVDFDPRRGAASTPVRASTPVSSAAVAIAPFEPPPSLRHPAPLPPSPPPLHAVPSPKPATKSGPVVQHDPSKPLPPVPPNVDIDLWARIVGRVRAENPSFASVLEHAAPLEATRSNVVLSFPPGSFLAEQVAEARHAEFLTRAVRDELGAAASVSIELREEAADGITLARIAAADRWHAREAAKARVRAHPLIQAALETLGAELEDVRVDEEKMRRSRG